MPVTTDGAVLGVDIGDTGMGWRYFLKSCIGILQGSENEVAWYAQISQEGRREKGKINGKKGKESKGGRKGREKKEGEKGKGIEWGCLLGKEKKVCKK